MSGFDDNFLESLENPFADPSITQATNNSKVVSNTMEDYNPFGDNLGNMTIPSATPGPAVLQPTQQLPVYSRSAQQTLTADGRPTGDISEFERRQAELDRKEQEINRREQELRNLQQTNVRRNNWPPLPEGFCVTPCFYIDIEMEIKVEFQTIVKRLYYLWILHGGMLVLNVFGTLCLLIEDGVFSGFIVSIVYLILFTPLSFLCWFRPVYKAFREDSSFQFMVFFFVFFFQFIMTTFMAIGFLNSGSCGIVEAIGTLQKDGVGHKIVGTIVLIIALGFAAVAAIELFLLATMLKIYRGTDASIDKARNEFTTGILGNPIVRSAATDAAAATIRSQLNQQPNRR